VLLTVQLGLFHLKISEIYFLKLKDGVGVKNKNYPGRQSGGKLTDGTEKKEHSSKLDECSW